MAIEFQCPACGQRMRVADEAIGRTGKCKACGTSVVVPQPVDEDEVHFEEVPAVSPRRQPPRERVVVREVLVERKRGCLRRLVSGVASLLALFFVVGACFIGIGMYLFSLPPDPPALRKPEASTVFNPADARDIRVTSLIVKRVDREYRYFFDIRNHSRTAFNGTMTLQLTSRADPREWDKTTFDTTKTIEPTLGAVIHVDRLNAPPSADEHAAYSISGFRYTVRDVSGRIVAQGSGTISSELE